MNEGDSLMAINALIAEHWMLRYRCAPVPSQASSADLPSFRLLKAKQELVGVTADRRVEHIFGVIVGLVCKN
jgi:hypothetical protein